MTTVNFPSSEDVTAFTERNTVYARASNQHQYFIGQVESPAGTILVQGVDWEFVPNFRFESAIQFLPPSSVSHTANGSSSSYTFTGIRGIKEVYLDGRHLQSGLDYTIVTLTTVLFVQPLSGTVPLAGQTITVIPTMKVQAGDTVRLRYNSWDIGTHRGWIISPPARTPTYDVIGRILKLTSGFYAPNLTLSINYLTNPPSYNTYGAVVRYSTLIETVMTNHLDYDSPNGFETHRTSGIIVLDTSDGHFWEWNGTSWVDDGVATTFPTVLEFFALRDELFYTWDGVTLTVVASPGSPPLLPEPAYGVGLAYGTYALGQMASASTDWPAAYQVVQNPGDTV